MVRVKITIRFDYPSLILSHPFPINFFLTEELPSASLLLTKYNIVSSNT